MKLSAGFWVYQYTGSDATALHPLAINQVVQIVEYDNDSDSVVWLTGVSESYTVSELLVDGRLLRKVRITAPY